ncbi:LLM class flavin-dependent oxidoreductase [Streptomyces naphthomycinicus]|uniref:LLM class flavin-dependent oxidoreductase n=1 Tax=Streptomyces naphthomycinicus TaxID=2872625 RepID=UPI001CED0E71|nr:LLM class flavin-dependent oxidoreductase [Streptomyces sp. TML10]
MRLSTVILPTRRWSEGGGRSWRRAEDLGFHAAYTYDHLSWRSLRDRAWFGAVPTLAAAAAVTRSIRLGTLVASPNFRHPVPFAKELMSLDDLSGGRVTLGVGAGADGFDATVLGRPAWSPRERAARFEEFLGLLDRLLRDPAVSYDGRFYRAHEAYNLPGCLQRPRLPFAVAATGPRGMALAARHGQAWVTLGDPRLPDGDEQQFHATIAEQVENLDKALAEQGRAAGDIERILLTGFGGGSPLRSADAFVDFAGRHAELGFTEIVVHWPVPDSVFEADEEIFERIVSAARTQLAGPDDGSGHA